MRKINEIKQEETCATHHLADLQSFIHISHFSVHFYNTKW